MNTLIKSIMKVFDPTDGLLQCVIAFALVGAWLMIVLGKAYGLVGPEYTDDSLLLSSVTLILGYMFGSQKAKDDLLDDK